MVRDIIRLSWEKHVGIPTELNFKMDRTRKTQLVQKYGMRVASPNQGRHNVQWSQRISLLGRKKKKTLN